MKRLGRLVAVLAAAVTLAQPALLPVAAQGAVPEYQRVIKARSASAAITIEAGCRETRIWIASSSNVFGGRPGRVVKQGLTTVLVQRLETCGPARVAAAAGEPPVGEVVFEGMGQTLDPLRSTPRFDSAWVQATVPLLDEVSGQTVPVNLHVHWSPSAPYVRDTLSTHVREPHGGIVNSHSQTRTAPALVEGTVMIADETFTFAGESDASLEQVKYGCQLIRHPHGTTALSC